MVPKLRRVVLTAALVALALVAGVAALHANREGKQPGEAEPSAGDAGPASVAVVRASLDPISKTLHLTGEIRAIRSARIRAETGGRVVEMPWRVGDLVRAGELLARLDGSKNRIAIRQARAAVAQGEISFEQARRKRERAQALFDGRKISVEKYDDAVFAHQKAESALEMRRAELESLERLAEDFYIRAPYDAYCGEIAIQLGDYVSPGTAAFSLVEAQGEKAVFKVPAEQITLFRKHATHPVWVPSLASHVDGRVAAVAREADFKSRTFAVELDLDPSKAPRAGMIAKLDVTLDTGHESLFVPAVAVVERFGGSYVFLVEEGLAREIPVTIEQRQGGRVAVSGNLGPGAQVVVRGQHRLENGARVKVVEGAPLSGVVSR